MFLCIFIERENFVFDDPALSWPESTFLACLAGWLAACRVVEIVVIKPASPIGGFGWPIGLSLAILWEITTNNWRLIGATQLSEATLFA